ncbi:LA_2272 family surface repeat-containing protein [Elizabethkingia anophelis]|uniref:LA_2272 family surface repeat-containing protein n=1 Tax=Elizabethkingia anophelis TaxID=1117645 RepID=UPI00293C6758|nr:hypothetical protein [Elizabethkingia anophelis]
MKTIKIIMALMLCGSHCFSQNTYSLSGRKTEVFSFSPKRYLDNNVNGINVGFLDDYDGQKINGINMQLNPLVIIYPLIPKAIDFPAKEHATVTVNGLHISTSGMMDGKALNGLGISAYHHAVSTNGVSVNFFNNTSSILNGIHVSGFSNNSINGNGVQISALNNSSENFKGLQIAAFNDSKKMKGLQIGIVNKAENLRGIQLGLWNKNEKRKLPFVNWN